MTPEERAKEIANQHGLSSLHIFTDPKGWRVFGFRRDAKGYQASVEDGRGGTILAALDNLQDRLIEGPIHAN